MGNNSKNASRKAQSQGYKIEERWRKNKRAKLEARVLRNSEDDSALKIFEAGSKTYGRQKPGKKGWFPPQEARFLSESQSDYEPKALNARNKLAKIRSIYVDKRPSAIKNAKLTVELPPLVADQFLTLGLINAKRHKSIKQSLGRLRRR
jgi:hypothetical protein